MQRRVRLRQAAKAATLVGVEHMADLVDSPAARTALDAIADWYTPAHVPQRVTCEECATDYLHM
jgi:hypothetical protein